MLLLPSDRWNGDKWVSQGLVVQPQSLLPREDDFQLSRPLSMKIVDDLLLKSSLSWEILPENVENDQISVSQIETKPEENLKTEHLTAVTTDYCSLQLVLSLLGPRDLAVCQAVCTQWREIATLPEVRGACLRRAWGVVQITANSSKEWSFLQAIESISSFVRRHHLLPRESLQAIAVRQRGDLTALKRLNSIISDYSLSCRSFIYVPGIKSLDELRGKALRYEYDHVSKRGQAVVLDSQEEDQASSSKVSEEASVSAEAVQPSAAQQAQILNKMSALLAKSLHIDEGAARYYIEEAGGDIKRAVLLARNDDSWATGAETPTSSRSGLQSRLRRILMLSGGGPAT